MIHALDEAGFGLGDDDKLRQRTPIDPNWRNPTGPTFAEVLGGNGTPVGDYVDRIAALSAALSGLRSTVRRITPKTPEDARDVAYELRRADELLAQSTSKGTT